MRRSVIGLLVAVLLSSATAAAASPLSDARARERALRSELEQATRALEAADAAFYEAERNLQFSQRRLLATRRDLDSSRSALAGQAAALYRSGGLVMADALLDRNADRIPARMELAMVVVSRQADTLASAEAASAAYTSALEQVTADERRTQMLREKAKDAMGDLTDRLREAERATARLSALDRSRSANTTPVTVSGGGRIACLMARPYTYVDTWGAPRSGGRSHQGTDVMAPYGTKVLAYTDGVISRESSNAYGGITLYLQGDNGVEYYYAHLASYAVPEGSRVRAGQYIANNGQSGNARYTAPHVHFEVHPGGPGSSPVNPYLYVKRVCG
jgi:murein DD-endopeptidase MepM/ murein hydrolase activator NlpD